MAAAAAGEEGGGVLEGGWSCRGRRRRHSKHCHEAHLPSILFSLHQNSHLADHYADDLEVELEAAMLDDFGAQLEDGSPREVRLKLFLSCLVFLADGG